MERKMELIAFLKEKMSCFAWDMSDMPEIDPQVISHSFPLLIINQLVDATVGHEVMSFMDAFSRYNQILMHSSDQEDFFMIERGMYCYKVMLSDLKMQEQRTRG